MTEHPTSASPAHDSVGSSGPLPAVYHVQAWSWTATVRANTDSEAVAHGAAPSPFTAALARLRVEASRTTSWRPLELHAVQLLASFPLSDAYQ